MLDAILGCGNDHGMESLDYGANGQAPGAHRAAAARTQRPRESELRMRTIEPERWQRIEQIFHAALEIEESRRAAFLEQACAEDRDLRREVDSLLAHHKEAGSFIESPALEMAARSLVPSEGTSIGSSESGAGLVGTTLSQYRVLEKLGGGGMGVVYKALDVHLDRPVAIKILRRDFTADRERKLRFIQEAKTASALNHPNILHVYDIDQSEGIDFMAMEYVPGKTLEELIGRKGLALKDVLK
jgi:eukaryotic-like serine/threonine-protein kinase